MLTPLLLLNLLEEDQTPPTTPDDTMGTDQTGYGLQLIRENETVDGFGVAGG